MPAATAVSPSRTMAEATTVAHQLGAHVLGDGLERDLHGRPSMAIALRRPCQLAVTADAGSGLDPPAGEVQRNVEFLVIRAVERPGSGLGKATG